MRISKDVFEKYVITVPPQKPVFAEGDSGEHMYVIIEGQVEIRKNTTEGAQKTLAVLHKGDIFGEMAIIEAKPRSATAVAMVKTSLLVMNENLFYFMLEKNPDFSKKMIIVLSERLRKANHIIQNLVTNNKEKQIYSGIIEFSKTNGVSSINGIRIKLADFLHWSKDHLGLDRQEILFAVKTLIGKSILLNAARDDEVLLPTQHEMPELQEI